MARAFACLARRGRGVSAGAGRDLGAALRNTFEPSLPSAPGLHWLAVAFGLGALVYFVLPREPLLRRAPRRRARLSRLAASSPIGAARRGGSSLSLAVLLAGATAAKLRVDRLDAAGDRAADLRAISAAAWSSRESRAELRPRIVLDRDPL